MRALATFSKIVPAVLLAAALGAAPARAGGALWTLNLTDFAPSPLPGSITAPLVRNFWDPRCLPVPYLVNNTLDPIPNPLGAPFLSLADATAAVQRAMTAWDQIPTSYIDLRIAGTIANPGFPGFDMKNEISFRTFFGSIGTSFSVTLPFDSELPEGHDLDFDGDSDVSSAITTWADVDGDGDYEIPAGFYKAGTLLDNDIHFGTRPDRGYRFTAADAGADTNTRSVDLQGVATHELGHSLGLCHVLDNNKSAADGNAATMFPFLDTGDPAAELAQRSLDSDDIAWASYFYPEGSAASGPAALQGGDVAFDSVYGLIQGTVTHGALGQPVAGASISALDRDTGEVFSSAFSGTVQVDFDLELSDYFFDTPEHNILDGRFVLPVKKGNWELSIEPVDSSPVPASSVGPLAEAGEAFGQLAFNEEFWNGSGEGAVEARSGEAKSVHVNPGEIQTGIDFVTNRETAIRNFGSRDTTGFAAAPGGRYYAVRIPASQVSAFLPGQDILIQSGAFDTVVADRSTVPLFAQAMLTTGSVSVSGGGATATVALGDPLEAVTGFVAADGDFAPLYFKNPKNLGKKVRRGIEKGEITNLFLVLRLPQGPFPGVSASPPLIGLDGGNAANDVPIHGLSYISDDGVTFTRVDNYNFRFSLILSEAE
jgi:hypothetical protein